MQISGTRERTWSRLVCASAWLLIIGIVASVYGEDHDQGADAETEAAVGRPMPKPLFEALAFEAAELGMLLAPSPHGELIVLGVKPSSSAARAGLRAGDFILSIGNIDVTSLDELAAVMGKEPKPESVTLKIWRGGKLLDRQVMLLQAHDHGAPQRRPFAGMQCDELESKGLVVRRILPGGPADKAGLLVGDVIRSANGAPLLTLVDAERFLRSAKPHDLVAIALVRDGQEQTVELKLASLRMTERGDYLESSDSPRGASSTRLVDLAAIALERERRNAEQHHRLERLMQEVRTEIRALRQKVEQIEQQ